MNWHEQNARKRAGLPYRGVEEGSSHLVRGWPHKYYLIGGPHDPTKESVMTTMKIEFVIPEKAHTQIAFKEAFKETFGKSLECYQSARAPLAVRIRCTPAKFGEFIARRAQIIRTKSLGGHGPNYENNSIARLTPTVLLAECPEPLQLFDLSGC